MNITTGSVVRAKAGRDKDKFFIVLRVEDGYGYIADGRRRKAENPQGFQVASQLPRSN
jgi:ribosomal protein L14E/L6E/L27E